MALAAAEAFEIADETASLLEEGVSDYGGFQQGSWREVVSDRGLVGTIAGGGLLGLIKYGADKFMAKRKRTGVAKRPTKRTKYNGGRRTGGRLNRRIGGFMGVELKYIDQTKTSTTLGSSLALVDPATNNHLTPIAEGSDATNRDGRRCIVKSIFIHGQVHWQTAPTLNSPGAVRLILIQDVQTNAAQMSPTDAFNTVSGAQDIMAFRNLEKTTRFRVLKEVWVAPPAVVSASEGNGTTATAGGAYVPFVMHIPNLNMRQTWLDANATVGSVSDNSLHLIALYGGDRTVSIQYVSRARFIG